MRKLIFLIVLLFCAIQSRAEDLYSYGESIDFQSGFVGSLWHPFMRLAKCGSTAEESSDKELLTIVMKTSDTYHTFPEGVSKLLIKFNDDCICELESWGGTIKNFKRKKIANSWVDVYYTGRSYIITEDVKQKLLSLPIIKVRIELGNGNLRDYQLGAKFGKKVLKKLQRSYKEVEKTQQIRIINSTQDLKNGF